jgi:hypothetical protein
MPARTSKASEIDEIVAYRADLARCFVLLPRESPADAG